MLGYALPLSGPASARYRDMFCEINIPGAYEWQKLLEGSNGNISGFWQSVNIRMILNAC